MKRLLISTGLVMALIGQAGLAQTSTDTSTDTQATPSPAPRPEIVAPEGYAREDRVLTAEDLLSANIYDASGESVGEVHDLVFESSSVGTGGVTSTDTGTTVTDTTAGTTGTGAATKPMDTTAADQAELSVKGPITHAVLDIGGFLGMGEYRVAVPVEDLAVFRSGSSVRIYLPWNEDQLKGLPAYDANNPETLGRSMGAPVN